MSMNFDAYKVQRPFPKASDFTEVQVVVSRKGVEKRVEFFDKPAFNEAKRKFHQEEYQLFQKFLNDMKVYLGIEENPKANLLISKAMDRGEGGMEGVLAWAEEMVDLIL